jgi:putative redox protein
MDVNVDVNWLGDGYHFEAANEQGGLIRMDGNTGKNGLHSGMSPMQMLLAGAAECSAIDVIAILEKQRQDLKSLTVDVTGDRVKLDADYSEYKSIHMHFTLSGNLDEKKVARALELSISKYCSVSKALEKASSISHDFSIEH